MSTPVLLSVVLSMQSALQAVSIASGYFNDIKASSVVTTPQALEAIQSTELPFLCLGHRIEAVGGRVFATSRPNAVQDRWRIYIEGRVDAPSADAAGKITVFSNIAADIEKALLVDPFRGAKVLYTYVMQPIPYFGDPSKTQVFFEQPVEVLLQRSYGVF